MTTTRNYWVMLVAVTMFAWTTQAQAAQVVYTVEGDSTSATDQNTSDGAQSGTFSATGVTVSSNAKFGTSALNFAGQTDALSNVEIPGTSGTSLGTSFTLAAFVDATTNGSSAGAMQRVFSNFAGSGPIDNILVFDMDPDASANFGLRLILNGTIIKASSSSTAAAGYADGAYHHVAVTYNNGTVKLYLDGVSVGGGTAGSGAHDIGPNNLFMGEDAGLPTAEGDQFIGDIDDAFVWNTALTPEEIVLLATSGASSYVSVPEPATLGLLVAGALCMTSRRRARIQN